MANFKFLILFSLLLITDISVKAQNWGCYDSLLINIGAFCIPDYDPVCACNGETYRNYCFAKNDGYQQYYNGICELIDFNIKTNPVLHNLELDLITSQEGNVTIHIVDWYGKVYYQDFFYGINRRQIQIPVGNFDQGVFMVIARFGDLEVVVKKFVKIAI
ncbi:MAG: hypothetical protein H0X62_04020 [Bacteroidetes bacterium]|nr:hypothetical protein [Bacteroidota bacterium]